MRYKKISYKKETVEIEYEEQNSAGSFNQVKITANEEPDPEFIKSLTDLSGIFVRLCELPKDDKKKITICSVHLSYHGDNDRMAVVISGYKKLTNYTGAVSMNSPLMFEAEDKANPKKDIPEELAGGIDEIKKQADKFMKGYRAQMKMDLNK